MKYDFEAMWDDEFTLEDVKCDLDNIEYNNNCENGYIIIADLGLWNGRRSGYKEINNLTQILKSELSSLTLDKDGVTAEYNHHDGTNYYEVRAWKNNIKNKYILEEAIYYDKEEMEELIKKFTKKIVVKF